MITQPIHLFLGDDYMKGHRPTAEAAPYNASDSNRAIMRDINGGTLDTTFIRPAPIIANEWSIEHVLQQIANPGTWTVNVTPSNCKATFSNASWIALQEGGALVSSAEAFMARCAVEPMFADLAPRLLFLVNGLGNFNAVTPRTVPYQIRPRGELERDGFTLHIVPSFASGAARNDLLLKLGGTNAYSVRLTLSGGASRLEVSVNSNVNSSSTFAHSALEELYVIVDWRRKRADVVRLATRQIAVTMTLTNGNWSAQESVDATFGSFDGDISAPQSRPEYASPRVDLCVMQFAENADLEDADILKNGIGYMRTRPWGSGMPVWLILPPATLLTSGDKLTARAAMFQAARELDGVSVFETRHLSRTTVSGRPVLTGASILDLASDLAHDARVLFTDRRRTMARPRRPGYERFADDDSANAFIAELIEAGAETRELSPMLGGMGRRSGAGVDAPWVYGTTQRGEGDFHMDPNTAERLVPIDILALQKGFSAPASDGVLLLPADTGTTVTSATAPTLERPRHADYRAVLLSDGTPRTRAQMYDPILKRIERTSSRPLLRGLNFAGLTSWTAGTGGVVTGSQAAPDGGSDASLMTDNSGVAFGIVRGPALAVTIGQPRWFACFVKRDPAATTFCDVGLEEGGLFVVGLQVDQKDGRIATIGSPLSYYIARHGDWFFVAFRYSPTVTNPNVAVHPAGGLLAAWPSLDVAAQGSVTVWGMPSALATSGTLEQSSNLTPYAYTAQPRVLRSGAALCEIGSTNYVTQGNQLSAWTASNATATRYDGRAPDASPNAWTITDASEVASGRISHTTGALPGSAMHTASAFFLKDETKTSMVELRVEDGTRQASLQLDVRTGAFAATSFGTPFNTIEGRVDLIVDDNDIEWWRAQLSFELGAAVAHTVRIYPAATTELDTENVTVTGSCVVALVQLENRTFATSYIPTTGLLLARTSDRNKILTGNVDASFYSAGFELDYWPEHDSGALQIDEVWLVTFDGGGAGQGLRLVSFDDDLHLVRYDNGAGAHDSSEFAFTRGDKITIRCDFGDDMRVYVNGVLVSSGNDISGEDLTAYSGDNLMLGWDPSNGFDACGAISELRAL